MIETLLLRTVIALTVASLATTTACAQLTVHFRSGTSLTGDLADQSIAWTTVAPNGAVSQFNYEASQIKSLFLSKSESSGQMIEVRQLLTQLGDDDYHKREAAQEKLKTVAVQFRNIVETFANHPSYELRYRVKRLLDEKSFKSNSSPRQKFDQITLTDGTTWEGEATNFALSLSAYGKTIQLNRENVAHIAAATLEESPQNEANERVEVDLFHRFEDFESPDQAEFRFDVRSDGKEFTHRTNINSYFEDDGLLFRNAEAGFVGISSYDFKFGPLPVGGRSVCNFGSRRGSDLKGILEIMFCEPGNSMVPAGVHEFGTFIAKVGFRRDIIMEAYGAEGQLLATVEGTDQKCVFAGVKSNQLITKVRVLSNPAMKRVERKIDDDFAIDTLRMSKPIATKVQRWERTRQVTLDNGDVLNWTGMSITKDGELRLKVSKVSEQSLEFQFPMDELRFVYFGRALQASTAWQALLDDGSLVNVLPGKSFRSERFEFSVSPNDFIGCWPAASAPRYPVAGDFANGGRAPLVVFPTCRFRTKSVEFGSDRLSWVVDEKLEQPLQLGDKDTDEDPTPQETTFKYANTLAPQLPTVWNKPPEALPVDGSYVYLTDGQRLSFGPEAQFQLKSISNRMLTLAHREGTPKDIPMTNVHSIQFGDR